MVLGEHPARDLVHRPSTCLDGRVRVEAAVLREARVHGDPEQPALSLGDHRHGRDRRRLERPAAQEPDAPRPLGHERVATGQEGERPRHLEPGRRPARRGSPWCRSGPSRPRRGCSRSPRRSRSCRSSQRIRRRWRAPRRWAAGSWRGSDAPRGEAPLPFATGRPGQGRSTSTSTPPTLCGVQRYAERPSLSRAGLGSRRGFVRIIRRLPRWRREHATRLGMPRAVGAARRPRALGRGASHDPPRADGRHELDTGRRAASPRRSPAIAARVGIRGRASGSIQASGGTRRRDRRRLRARAPRCVGDAQARRARARPGAGLRADAAACPCGARGVPHGAPRRARAAHQDGEIAEGSLTQCPVSPRDALREPVPVGAHGVVFVHNHPSSGDPSPSADDADLTDRLRAAADLCRRSRA